MSGHEARPVNYVGRPVLRLEDPRLLRGLGRYLDDVPDGGAGHVAFVRSPHARARVRAVDLDAARRAPGVLAVLGPGDADGRLGPIRANVETDGYHVPPRPLLPRDIRTAGDPVAAVVAESAALAIDAAERVAVEYDPLPGVTHIEAALAPGAPRVHEDVAGNVLYRAAQRFGDVEAAFAAAEVTVRARFVAARVTGVPLEPRGCLAIPDPGRGTLDLWVSNQAPHIFRTAVAEALGLAEAAVRVRVPDVGGGFGIKIATYPEEVLVAYLAWTLGRPVKWVQRRSEDLQASAQCRDQVYELELAAQASGEFLGLRARILTNSGAWGLPPHGAVLQPSGAARALPGPYRYLAYACEVLAVATHTSPAGPYRGVAQPNAVLARERLIDLLARRLGQDPAALRRRNLLDDEELARGTINGVRFESCSFRATLEAALEAAGYDEFRREQGRAAAGDAGIGIAVFAEATGLGSVNWQRHGMRDIPGFDTAHVRVLPDGTVEVASSVPSIGQGHETVLAQVVADEIGARLEAVRVRGTDTAATPYGTGVFASRGVIAGGGSALLAARRVGERLRRLAGALLECAPEDVVLHDGAAHPAGLPDRRLPLASVARAAYFGSSTPHPGPRAGDGEAGLEATAVYDPPPVTFANGCHVVRVRVDRETGRVNPVHAVVAHDCGRVVNTLLVDGQVQGGMVQGLGNALAEELVYDAGGQLLTATLMDYPLPRASDAPPLAVVHLETPSGLTVGGFKGVGESGLIGVAGAVANAVADALPEVAAQVTEVPLTPRRIWALLGETEASRTPPAAAT
jgi:carbon-monoxide dehydrogenase large subunit